MKKAVTALFLLILLAFCLAGCQKKPVPAEAVHDTAAAETAVSMEDYLASVKGKADEIISSLEQDALTQTDMNLKSKELSDLWDEALNRLLEEAKKVLPEAEWARLTAEQNIWLADKQSALEAAGKEVEGGSMYALVVNCENAKLTEERVYKLYEMLV